MEILIIEPFYTGSHKQWANGYASHSTLDVSLLTMPGRYWKWRMAGACIELAQQYKKLKMKPKLILASDMLDVATFKSLSGCTTPIALYFHENQINYPWSLEDPDKDLQRDHHYGLKNITSSFIADFIFFNSNYHLHAFMDSLGGFVRQFPDFNNWSFDSIYSKSRVLSLGVDLKSLAKRQNHHQNKHPVILWNHRWEYDKNPSGFYLLLKRLKAEGVSFQLVLLGENFKRVPEELLMIKNEFSDYILHTGFLDKRQDYAHWLASSDLLPVTSRHDFFGTSVIEAIYCGVYPLLPNRLVYPEHIPSEMQKQFLYESESDLVRKVIHRINQKEFEPVVKLSKFVEKYDWVNMAPIYDKTFGDIINR